MESTLSSIIDALPGLVWTALPDGHVDFVNRRWCDFTGLDSDTACGMGWQIAIHPQDMPTFVVQYQNILTSNAPGEMEARLLRFDGAYHWFLFRASPIADANGSVIRWCGINIDIDDRKRAEASLRTSESHFRSIVDGIPAFVTLWTSTGDLDFANRHYLEYFGKTLEELKRWGKADTFHPDDRQRVLATLEQAVITGQPCDFEGRRRRFDGVYRWFHMRGSPLRDEDGHIVLWYLLHTDIDDRKRAEALLAGEKQLLEMVASGRPLPVVLGALCSLLDATGEACMSNIILLDSTQTSIRHVVGPGLPFSCHQELEHQNVNNDGAKHGMVETESPHSIGPCLSSPIVSLYGEILGTLTLYFAEPRVPNNRDFQLTERACHVARIAIERERSQMSLTQALNELKKSEDQLRTIVDTIPTIAWRTLPNGSGEFSSQRWHDYTGLPLNDARGWGWQAVVHPDDVDEVISTWLKHLVAGQPGELEGRLRRFDGKYRWFLLKFEPLRNETGAIVNWYGTTTDIDDRKRAEALLAGEKQLLEMVAGGHSMAAILEALCRLVETAAVGCYCGVVLVDSSGTRLEHGAAPSLPASFIASVNGRPVTREAGPCAMAAYLNEQVIAPDLISETRWTTFGWCQMALAHGLRSCWSKPIHSASGHVLGALAIYYDEPRTPAPEHQDLIEQLIHIASIAIERARSDAALKASEARKTAILNSALDCIVTIDHEGCITEFNPAAERTFGYQRGEVLGKPLSDVIVPQYLRENHRRGLARYLATGETRVLGRRVEMTAVRSDGNEFPVELAITIIPMEGPPSFTGYLRDITERRKSEQELRRSQAYLAEAQRLSLTGSFGWNVLTDKHSWSEETFRIFEYDPSTKVTLQLIFERIHPQDVPIIKNTMARVADGKDFDYECRFLMPNGALKHLHIVAHATRDHDGQLEYIGAVQDVTERRLSDEALARTRSELARVARISSLGALTASIAHEVNQPLSGIITNASTCLRMLGTDPPNVTGARETARRTIRDGNRASDVIARLRALFSKKDTTTETVDLNEATREVIALSLAELQRNRAILRQELADNLPLVTGDRVQLQQVILNLLLNASDAMANVDDRPRQLLVRTEQDQNDYVRLTVQDSGVGFEPSCADRLFEAFYTTKSGGMGIGLSVSRSIIESHSGRLWAAPNNDAGATFSFAIPRHPETVNHNLNLGAIRASAATDVQQVMRNP